MSGSSNGNAAAAAAAAAAMAAAAANSNGGGGGGHVAMGNRVHRNSGGGSSVVGAGLPALGTGVSSNPSSPRAQPRPQTSSSSGGGGGGTAPRPPPLSTRGTPPVSLPPGVNNLNHLSDRLGSLSTSLSDELSLEDPNAPAKHDFMVSFLVDARGGSMVGCRSGVKVTIPPKVVPQPMRITCRYVRSENLLYPPKLNDGEELACRILQVGPAGSKFLGPVLIEVPHVASLRRGERELAILRCESAVDGVWEEHRQDPMEEKALKDTLSESVSNASSASSSPSRVIGQQHSLHAALHQPPPPPERTVCVVAHDFPQFFAVISRSTQEVSNVGAQGATLAPSRMPRIRVQIPPKALTKEVDIGISAQHIEDEVVEDILMQGGAVSPIVTIEPRRRKFHRPVTVTIPLPERMPQHFNHHHHGGGRSVSAGLHPGSAGSSRKTSMESLNRNFGGISTLTTPMPHGGGYDTSSILSDFTAPPPNAPIETALKLVCSMSGNRHRACWEDVTETTPLTFTSGGVQFSSVVSASFWVIDCPKWMSSDVMSLVDQLYKNTMRVPYLAKFYLYARRHSAEEVAVRALCLTETERAEHPLELQEDFVELCRSEYVEIYDKAEVHVKFSGNLLKCEVISAAAMAADKAAAEAAMAAAADADAKSIVAGSVVGATLSFMGGTGTIVFKPFSDNRQAYLLRRRNEKNPYPKGRVTFFTGMTGMGERILFETKIDLTKYMDLDTHGHHSRKVPTRIGEH